jgi:hypothetical protein
LLLEDGDESRVQIDSPNGSRTLSPGFHNLQSKSRCELGYTGTLTREVNVLPPEPDQFADADAGADKKGPRRYSRSSRRRATTPSPRRRRACGAAGGHPSTIAHAMRLEPLGGVVYRLGRHARGC